MNAAELVAFLQQEHFAIGLSADRQRITVKPCPTEPILAQLRAERHNVLAVLRERLPNAETCHRFVALRSADPQDVRTGGACLACRWSHLAHRSPPVEAWRLVNEPGDVVLELAASVVAIAAASCTLEAS